MGTYRISRNIESSIIDYLIDELASSWSNVNVEKTFARVYELSLPTVCVRLATTEHPKAQIGDNSTYRIPQILIDVFCTSDGQRLDLKDFLIEKLRGGLNYYEYTTSGNTITDKTQNGRIRVLSIDDIPIEFDTDKDNLDVHDRYRHLLTLTISLGRIEA